MQPDNMQAKNLMLIIQKKMEAGMLYYRLEIKKICIGYYDILIFVVMNF